MELKEYLLIIKKDIQLFLAIIILVIAGAFSYFYFQPVSYNASLVLNITRQGTQKTQDYRYDDFYRLQADERFADTVVEWIKSPRVMADVQKYSGANINKLSAERRSSQVILINFAAASEKNAQSLSSAIKNIISQNTDNLNRDQQEETWFKVLADSPVIAKNIINYKKIFLAALLAGIFLGFWIVLVKHYLK